MIKKLNNPPPTKQTCILKEARYVLEVLENANFQARLAGGCVRDRLLNITPKDYDVATSAKPEAVIEAFQKLGIKVLPTGVEHGTVTIILKHSQVEVTTLRKDISTDGRHAQVSFTNDFEQDAARRDFTVNALSENRQGQVFDYFSGQRDLENKILRFVGIPAKRITEDYLRILRLFRFWATYELTPTDDAINACKNYAKEISKLSQERITSEIMKMFSGKFLPEPFKCANSIHILQQVLPISPLEDETVQWICRSKPSRNQRVRALKILTKVFWVGKPSQPKQGWFKDTMKMRLSRHQACFVSTAIDSYAKLPNEGAGKADIMVFFDSIEPTAAGEADLGFFFDLWSDFSEFKKDKNQCASSWVRELETIYKQTKAIRSRPNPINGKDLIRGLNIPKGPKVGMVLERFKKVFYEKNGKIDKKEAMKLCQEIYTSLK